MERPYRSLRQVLASKPDGVHTVAIGAMVWDALQLMAEKDIGAVVVVDDGRVVGLLSERDYARKGILLGRTARDTPVRDVLNETVITVAPERTVPECMALMTAHRTRHLPVLERERLIGILSIGDLVKEVISHHEHVIKEMELERLILFSQGTYSC
jgi:FOG: CBS domain